MEDARRKPGRPALPPDARKSVRLDVRFTPSHADELCRQALAESRRRGERVTVSDLIRRSLNR